MYLGGKVGGKHFHNKTILRDPKKNVIYNTTGIQRGTQRILCVFEKTPECFQAPCAWSVALFRNTLRRGRAALWSNTHRPCCGKYCPRQGGPHQRPAHLLHRSHFTNSTTEFTQLNSGNYFNMHFGILFWDAFKKILHQGIFGSRRLPKSEETKECWFCGICWALEWSAASGFFYTGRVGVNRNGGYESLTRKRFLRGFSA